MQVVQTVGLVGAGAIGSALGKAIQKAGKIVLFWDKDPAKSTAKNLDELVEKSQLIILCIPSWANAAVAQSIAHKVSENSTLVLSVAKGVGDDFKLIPEILETASQSRYDTGVLYGPMLAEEITEGKYASAVMATSNDDWRDCLDLTAGHLFIRYSSNPKSIALCGVLKNIYAIGFGINDGLGLGQNAKGQLAVAVLAEMKQLVSHFGGDPSQAEDLAGLGDLLATGWSESSFNHRIGKALAENMLDEEVDGEGVHSLVELAKVVRLSKYPIAQQLHLIINAKAKPESLRGLLG